MSNSVERTTLRFYEWERRGRGWQVYNQHVDLEPPFDYFNKYSAFAKVEDDGYVPSILEKLTSLLRRKKPKDNETEKDEQLPFAPVVEGDICVLRLSLPKNERVGADASKQLLLMLSDSRCFTSYELIASSHEISVQFACREPDLFNVRNQVKAYFPACVIDEQNGIETLLNGDQNVSIVDLGLREEFMRPLQAANIQGLDSLTGVFAVLDGLQGSERAILQVIFKGAVEPWAESVVDSVTDAGGDSFFMDAPEMPKLARQKVSSPLYGVVIRCAAQCESKRVAASIAQNLARCLIRTTESESNSLIQLNNEDYALDYHVDDMNERQSRRLGMLLNMEELVSLVHLPSPTIASTKLGRNSKKTKHLPNAISDKGVMLGTNTHQGRENEVYIASEQRLRHMHIIGATGTGKTTLMENCIMQDIAEGRGCAVIDPHGDLIESILGKLPEHRVNDTILIDPSDAMFPIGFNMLTANTEYEKDVLSSDLIAAFRRLSTSWGDQMNSVFANAILAFLENSKRGTLIDLRRFLVEKEFRESYLETVTDPNILYYWQKEYPIVKGASIGPILTRLDTFLRPKVIRNMVAQERCIDFADVLNGQKVLLIKLAQGLIGDENSYLLGTAFLSKIYQAAMARQVIEKSERKDYFIYVDEFQNFITPSLSQILSGARKYHLGLVLAHQEMQQLVKDDSSIASSVMGNAGTRICFRLGDSDAKRFEDGFANFNSVDLLNLGIGEAIARVGRADHDFNFSVSPKQTEVGSGNKEKVVDRSRKLYGKHRNEVESALTVNIEEKGEEKDGDLYVRKVKNSYIVEPDVLHIAETGDSPTAELTNDQIEETKADLVRQKEVSQHRYQQALIKRMAEGYGYKAVIEESTSDGKGRVDVSLKKGEQRIACEIGMTTTKQWEIHNLVKCVNSGYEIVIAVAKNENAVKAMQQKVEALDEDYGKRIKVMDLEGLIRFLSISTSQNQISEKLIKGYRVKVEYGNASDKAIKARKASIVDAVIKSIKK